MTVASNDLLVGPVTPTNGTTLISLDFYFENASDLEVYKSGSNTPLTITTDYTVSLPSGVNETDGSITLVTPADGTDRYSIYLKQPLARSSDLQFRSDQRSPVLNLELDRLWRAIQGIDTALDRVFRFSQTSDVPLPLDAETAAARSNQLIGFTADGTQLALIITPEGLNTLAGLTDEIAAIGSLETEIGALYVIRTDITALAAVASDVDALGELASEIVALAAIDTEIGQVAAVAADVTTVATNIDDVVTVADNMASILAALAGALTGDDIGVTVQGYSANLAAFSGKSAPSGAVVGTTDTQTLSGKTLTAPRINLGSDAEGDIYYRNASGLLTRLPRGANGQQLSLVSGVPAWVDAAGGGLVPLETVVLAGGESVLDLTAFDNATYNRYRIEFDDMEHSATGNLLGRLSSDGGSNFLTANSYETRKQVSGTDSSGVSTAFDIFTDMSTTADAPTRGYLELFSLGAGLETSLYGFSPGATRTATTALVSFAGAYQTAVEHDAFQFLLNTGTFNKGRATLYGYADA
jgi:hypothetical protein